MTTAQLFTVGDFDRLVGRDPAAVRRRLVALERLLEGLVRLPGNQRVGLDGFIGLVPVVGDMISLTLGTWLVWEARNLGMPRWRCVGMLGRVGLDAAIGAVPVVGDIADFFYRSNTKNVKALLAYLDRTHPGLKPVRA
jgi:hypothetical protein